MSRRLRFAAPPCSSLHRLGGPPPHAPVDPAQHRLVINGLVRQPLSWLRERMMESGRDVTDLPKFVDPADSIDRAASENPEVVAMPVGQIVGRMNEIRPVAEVMAELVSGFEDARTRLDSMK